MHKIADKEFTLGDFSHEHLFPSCPALDSMDVLEATIDMLNSYRTAYLKADENSLHPKKDYWWQMIQLLPSSYNQRRTVQLNYEVLANIYKSRKNHKLDEWARHDLVENGKGEIVSKHIGFCDWIHTLPYSELITGKWSMCKFIPIEEEE